MRAKVKVDAGGLPHIIIVTLLLCRAMPGTLRYRCCLEFLTPRHAPLCHFDEARQGVVSHEGEGLGRGGRTCTRTRCGVTSLGQAGKTSGVGIHASHRLQAGFGRLAQPGRAIHTEGHWLW